MTFDVDATAARHQPLDVPPWQYCDGCGEEWPCDTAQALEVIRERDREIENVREGMRRRVIFMEKECRRLGDELADLKARQA